LEFGAWSLGFIWNLVLVVWNLSFDSAQDGEPVEPFVFCNLVFVICLEPLNPERFNANLCLEFGVCDLGFV
jgi:hypothetical protein